MGASLSCTCPEDGRIEMLQSDLEQLETLLRNKYATLDWDDFEDFGSVQMHSVTNAMRNELTVLEINKRLRDSSRPGALQGRLASIIRGRARETGSPHSPRLSTYKRSPVKQVRLQTEVVAIDAACGSCRGDNFECVLGQPSNDDLVRPAFGSELSSAETLPVDEAGQCDASAKYPEDVRDDLVTPALGDSHFEALGANDLLPASSLNRSPTDSSDSILSKADSVEHEDDIVPMCKTSPENSEILLDQLLRPQMR